MKYDAAKSPFVVVVPCVARCSLLCFAVLCVARHAVSTTMRPTTQNTQHQGPRASALARGGTESSYVSVCSCGSAWFGVGFLMELRACDFPTERALLPGPPLNSIAELEKNTTKNTWRVIQLACAFHIYLKNFDEPDEPSADADVPVSTRKTPLLRLGRLLLLLQQTT